MTRITDFLHCFLMVMGVAVIVAELMAAVWFYHDQQTTVQVPYQIVKAMGRN